jgi:aldehyde:ferredoxin oxidoreductase
MLKLRRGRTRADNHLPDPLLKPLSDGVSEGTVPDVKALLSGTYAKYGWDPKTGRPTLKTLKMLGLGE